MERSEGSVCVRACVKAGEMAVDAELTNRNASGVQAARVEEPRAVETAGRAGDCSIPMGLCSDLTPSHVKIQDRGAQIF